MDVPLNLSQLQVVQRFSRLAEDWTRSGPIEAQDMGRSAGKIESIEAMLEQLTEEAVKLSKEPGSGKLRPRLATSGRPSSMLSEVQLAKPIESDRLKFGGVPRFSPMPFLDKETAAMYERPLDFAMPAEESQSVPPRVQVRGRRSQILALLHRLDASDRLAIFPSSQIRRSHTAGLFAIMKNLTTDRLIMDSRPANELEPAYGRWTQTMAAITPLFQMHLKPSEFLRVSGEDLKDYYYYFKVSSNRARRNALRR